LCHKKTALLKLATKFTDICLLVSYLVLHSLISINLCPLGSGSSSRGQGALASYIAVPAHHVSHKPASMKFTEAAGLSLVGLTATEGLLEHGQLKEGQHVLINGGSSAVGLMAVQIAKAHGCIVTCTASTKNISLLKALGADEVLCSGFTLS